MIAEMLLADIGPVLADALRWLVTIVVLVGLVFFWHFLMSRFGTF